MIIYDMSMPKDCAECDHKLYSSRWCNYIDNAKSNRPQNCPIYDDSYKSYKRIIIPDKEILGHQSKS